MGPRQRSEIYYDSIYVETRGVDFTSEDGLDDAPVSAPGGCIRTLSWDEERFTWRDLRERATVPRPKGTFWVNEMEQLMRDVASSPRPPPEPAPPLRPPPPIMTSTFRGKGKGFTGLIFRPQLLQIDFEGDRPVRYHFIFPEVLVPELVRGPGDVGAVFNLIHIATRTRWEVLEPFLGTRSLQRPDLSDDERRELVDFVRGSLHAIDLEAEKHEMLHPRATLAFEGAQLDAVIRMLDERASIYEAIDLAVDKGDLDRLIEILLRALDLNSKATVMLADRFLKLAEEDWRLVQRRMTRARSEPSAPLLASAPARAAVLRNIAAPKPRQIDRVFICYSRKDARWLERLKLAFAPVTHDGSLDLWDDTRIGAGESWRDEIEQALDRARTAILLVSAHFCASDFIHKHELPRLLDEAQNKQLRIFTVFIGPCLDEIHPLNNYQPVNSRDRPLASLRKYDADLVLVNLARMIIASIRAETAGASPSQ